MTTDLSSHRAWLFDLDGVLTPTAEVHAAAWKRTFDDFLREREGDGFRPFDDDDYRRHVDGRPRYQGVDRFLRSRGIELPRGAPEDSPGTVTVCAVGNRKNQIFNLLLEEEGVEPYPGSVRLVEDLIGRGVRRAVVSSSANAAAVLRAAGIDGMFQARVDGLVARELGLPGKPRPDTFLEAARLLDTEPAEAVVVEDATSGVAAGRAGGFGLVVGVDRHDDPQPLLDHGADLVVSDLGELMVGADG